MKDNILYSNVATEVLEICNYLDEDILLKIPKKVIENLYRLKNNNYIFHIDKSKSLKEQNILKETKEILSIIYLKYCCTKEEADKFIKENNQRVLNDEKEKELKYSTDNIFKNNSIQTIQENNNQLINIDKKPFYLNIIEKIKNLFSKIFGKREK